MTPAEALEVIAEETEKGWRNPKLVEQFTEFIKTTVLSEHSVAS
jgi:putative two-component system response regulator